MSDEWFDSATGQPVGEPDGTVYVATDLDGDGEPDVVQGDLDQDGYFETTYDPVTGAEMVTEPSGLIVPPDVNAGPGAAPSAGGVGDVANPTPPAASEGLHGDPDAEIRLWFNQAENGFCVPASVAMIVGEFIGQDPRTLEDDMVGQAQELGFLTGGPGNWSGLSAEQGAALLEQYGVPAHVETGSMQELADLLDQNRGIILSVDSHELPAWNETEIDGPLDQGADHAVVITGIDFALDTVYLNDPGNPDGAEETLTVEQLQEAWDDSGNSMIVTDASPQAIVEPAVGAAPGTEIGGEPLAPGRLDLSFATGGFALLPLTIPAELLRPVQASL